MTKNVKLFPNPFQSLIPHEDIVYLTPNVHAARALNVPYQSLRTLARKTLFNRRLGVAPEFTASRILQETVKEQLNPSDVMGTARMITPALRLLLQAGTDFDHLIQSGSQRCQQLACIAQSYRTKLREHQWIDSSELFWEAAKGEPERQAVAIHGYPCLKNDELNFILAIADEGSEIVLPYPNHAAFENNWTAAHYLKKHGWKYSQSENSPASLGERLSARFLGLTEEAIPLQAYEYPHLEAEVRGTLIQVKQLLANGISPENIALVTRNENYYANCLQSIAWEYQIPIQFSHEIPLKNTRLGAWIELMFHAIQNRLPFETTARLLRHPLGPGLPEKTWNNARRFHRSGLDQWQISVKDLKKLKWPEQDNKNKYMRRLHDLLETFHLRRRTAFWAQETIAFYKLQDGLTELERIPDRKISLSRFIEDVTELLTVFTTPVNPGRGGVEFHTPQSLSGARFKHVFLLGAAEGIFPAPIHDDVILDFHDRESLKSSGLILDNAVDAAMQETAAAWSMLQTVTESFTLSYPKSIGRDEFLPSKLFDQLEVSPSSTSLHAVASGEEIRKYALPRKEQLEDPVLQFAHHAWSVESNREGRHPYDEYDGIPGVPILPETRTFSASQLRDLGQCPFKWFAAKVLRLKEMEEAEEELSPGLKGTLCHAILEKILLSVKESENPREAALEYLETAVSQAEQELNFPSLPVWEAHRAEIMTMLRRVILSDTFILDQCTMLEAEKQFEGSWFGLKVQGFVDRIDRGPDGLIFIDYKTSTSIQPGIKNMERKAKVDIQIPLYVQVAADVLFPGETVARAYYYSLPNAEILKEREFTQEQDPNSELAQFAENVKEMLKTGHYPIQPDINGEACRYCPFPSVCRRGTRLSRKGSIP